MTKQNSTINNSIVRLNEKVIKLKYELEVCYTRIKFLQKSCKHFDKIRWTNNDGDGQFIVERCNECGLQKDGGLT